MSRRSAKGVRGAFPRLLRGLNLAAAYPRALARPRSRRPARPFSRAAAAGVALGTSRGIPKRGEELASARSLAIPAYNGGTTGRPQVRAQPGVRRRGRRRLPADGALDALAGYGGAIRACTARGQGAGAASAAGTAATKGGSSGASLPTAWLTPMHSAAGRRKRGARPGDRAVPSISRSAAGGRVHPCRRSPTISAFDGSGSVLDARQAPRGQRHAHVPQSAYRQDGLWAVAPREDRTGMLTRDFSTGAGSCTSGARHTSTACASGSWFCRRP